MAINVPLAMAAIAPRERTRFTLDCVVIQKFGERIFAMATDGRILAITNVDGELEKYPAFIPRKVIEEGKRVSAVVPVSLESSEWVVRLGDMSIHVATADDCKYPPIADVLPDRSKAVAEIWLDANLLAKLASAISENGRVKLSIEAANKPVVVQGACGVGVMMPVNSLGDTDEYDAIREMIRSGA